MELKYHNLPFETSDLALISALYIQGFRELNRTVGPRGRVSFHFQRTSDLESAENNFWRSDAFRLMKIYKELKREIINMKSEELKY